MGQVDPTEPMKNPYKVYREAPNSGFCFDLSLFVKLFYFSEPFSFTVLTFLCTNIPLDQVSAWVFVSDRATAPFGSTSLIIVWI